MSNLVKESEEVTINLIPIMNLFTALIPFLLMSAVFYQLSVVRISVPVASDTGETDIAKEEDKITLNMRITRESFDLSGSSDTLDPSILKRLKAQVPRAEGDEEAQAATYAQLSEAAFQIKGKYTSSDTSIVVPDDDIPYEHVVGALDAVREIWVDRNGDRLRVVLFPRVVLSSLVK